MTYIYAGIRRAFERNLRETRGTVDFAVVADDDVNHFPRIHNLHPISYLSPLGIGFLYIRSHHLPDGIPHVLVA